jgi:hypothetical protein
MKSKPTEWTIVPHYGNISEKDLVKELLICYTYHKKVIGSDVQNDNKNRKTKGGCVHSCQ